MDEKKVNEAALFSNFCETTSAHGLSKISGSKNRILRSTWALIFLVSLTIFFWQASMLILDKGCKFTLSVIGYHLNPENIIGEETGE